MILHLIDDFTEQEQTPALLDLLSSTHNAKTDHAVFALRNRGDLAAKLQPLVAQCLHGGTQQIDVALPFVLRRAAANCRVIHHWGFNRVWARTLGISWQSRTRQIVSLQSERDYAIVCRVQKLLRGRTYELIADTQALQQKTTSTVRCIPAVAKPVTLRKSTEQIAASREQLLDQLGFVADTKIMLTAGPLTNEKRTDELFWMVDQVSCVYENIVLIVCGVGPTLQKYRKYAELYGVGHKVVFLEDCYDWSTLLACADLYCAADLSLGSNYRLLSAVSHGVPVVVTDTPAHRELISHGQNGLLVDHSMKAELAKGVVKFFDSPDLAATLRNNAASIDAESKWNNYLEQYRNLYSVY
jgi:glycosyltransferase involved in cell wall biosynthesis